jgi:xanthine dehydrogenase accessory factor
MLEARVIEAAQHLLGRDAALVIGIHMTGKDVAGTDMVCGGNVDVLVQGITPENTQACEVMGAVRQIMEEGGKGIFVTGPLPDKDQEAEVKMLFCRPGGVVVGSVGDDEAVLELIEESAEEMLRTGDIRVVRIGAASRPLVFDPVFSRPTVIIFGGGHISVHLAPLLTMVDFSVVVVDDRTEFANQERFPQADQIVVSDFEDCFDKLEFTPETYCVIVTRGHLHDKTVLENVLSRSTHYVGMIGSRRKRNMIYEELTKHGIGPKRLKEVHAPIGLSIGADTPEAIAISIAAELIQVRAKG